MAKVAWKTDVTKIDAGVKNTWCWSWLEKIVDNKIGAAFDKINKAGFAFCKLCRKEINYGKRGCVALESHVTSAKHKELLHIQKTNYALPGQQKMFSMFKQPSGKDTGTDTPTSLPHVEPQTPVKDRVHNAEAMVLSFVAENSMSFSQVPKLITLAKALSTDKCALDQLSMDRTSASYKMTHGLGYTYREKLINDMRNFKFSLNIDEATSSNNQRVLAIMVSYFSIDKQEVIVHHLDSIAVVKVDSQTLFQTIDKLFTSNNIPWTNLMSILMDSCAVMRGSKKGLETLIRKERAPHLLDIDGDTCHHAHNAAKRFCKPFEYHVEGLVCDIHSDFKWSVDHREVLQMICSILGKVKYTVPERYVSHRWLSIYDVTVDTLRLFDAYTLFFYPFLPKTEASTYQDIVADIHTKYDISQNNQDAISKLMQPILKKTLTSEGKDRKMRIVDKLFFQRKKTCLIMQFYSAVLGQLKKYVVMFQSKDTKVDKLHDEQVELAIHFLSNFIKPEHLKGLSSKKLVNFPVSDPACHLSLKDMFVGFKTRALSANSTTDKSVAEFMQKAQEAYISCSSAILSKMPINNPMLKAMSALDPIVRQHATTQHHLLQLPTLATNIISEDSMDDFDKEVRSYTVDQNLPGALACQDEKLDLWWASVDRTGRYPLLTAMVKGVISCFHGPQVESSFSIMGEVLDESSSNMRIDTYSAIQTVKYELMAQGSTSVEMFLHKEPKYAKVDPVLCRNLQGSYKRYQEVKESRQTEMREKHRKCGIVPSQAAPVSKRKFKEILSKEAESCRLQHSDSSSKRKKIK